MVTKTAHSPSKKTMMVEAALELSRQGKLPPQAIDMEIAVLGACLLDKDALAKATEILQPESFYKEAHELTFAAIKNLVARHEPADALTVTQELRRLGTLERAGGAYEISNLTNRIGSGANIEYHARIVAQKYIQRELIRVSMLAAKGAYDETSDVFELVSSLTQELQELNGSLVSNVEAPLEEITAQTITIGQTRQKLAQEGKLSGVPSGFNSLDYITNGWQPADLIVWAGRPSMGKTSTAVHCIKAAAEAGCNVRVFSLEVNANKITEKLILGYTSVEADNFAKGQLLPADFEQLEEARQKVNGLKIRINDRAALSAEYMNSVCRNDARKGFAPQLIVIDYLQLMSTDYETNKNYGRVDEVSGISRALKALAKITNAPVIAISQLNRESEKRTGHLPRLSDLRDSGAIEQDADLVIFPFRPIVYGAKQDAEGNSQEGFGQFIIAKHRNGALGEAPFYHSADMTQFYNHNEIYGTKKNLTRVLDLPF